MRGTLPKVTGRVETTAGPEFRYLPRAHAVSASGWYGISRCEVHPVRLTESEPGRISYAKVRGCEGDDGRPKGSSFSPP